MASSYKVDTWERVTESYSDTGYSRCVKVTLGTPGDITVLPIDHDAKGLKIFPINEIVIFTVYDNDSYKESPEILKTSSNLILVPGDLGIGHVAIGNLWEVRLLPAGEMRQLQLTPTMAGTVVYVEFWG